LRILNSIIIIPKKGHGKKGVMASPAAALVQDRDKLEGFGVLQTGVTD